MLDGWSKQYEFDRLADTHAGFDYAIPVGELAGLPGEVSAADAPLQAQLRFGREQGLPVVEVRLQGAVTMICQRCLGPMRQPVNTTARVALLASESEADRVPESLETFLAPEGRLTAAALVSEELLLALPIAPRHEVAMRCQAATDVKDAGVGDADSQHPFADLRAMLKRDPR
jgi:uncharacterized protein